MRRPVVCPKNAFEASLEEFMLEQWISLECMCSLPQPLPGIDDQRISVKARTPIVEAMCPLEKRCALMRAIQDARMPGMAGNRYSHHHEPAVWPHRHMLAASKSYGPSSRVSMLRLCAAAAPSTQSRRQIKDVGSNVCRVLLLKPNQFLSDRIAANLGQW